MAYLMANQEARDMVDWWWSGAVVLTMAGALFFWGSRVFPVESFAADSSALLGLALVLAAIACF